MKRFLAVVAIIFATAVCLGANAYAQEATEPPGTGPYLAGHLGLNIADSDINGGALPIDYDAGFGLGVVLGYDFGNFRVDGEFAFRLNTVEGLGGNSLDPKGLWLLGESNNSTSLATSFMVNGYFDLPTDGPVKPYIGGGVGLAAVSVDWKAPGKFIPLSYFRVADDSDSGLAYQISGGIGIEINPKSTLTVGYRYFATEELQMRFDNNSPINSGQPFTLKYQSHEFNIGVRVMFN